MSRLTASFWVQAYLMRLQAEGIFAHVVRRGDPVAGSVLVKTATMDGRAAIRQRSFDPATGARTWMLLAEDDEAAIDAIAARQRGRDPDLWIVEVEDPRGRHLLDQPGLSD